MFLSYLFCVIFFFKQKTSYDMRISDCSSDVCSSDLIKPAFGYRIDYDGRAVAISGDTRLSENVSRQGTGVDLIIHEVAAVRPDLLENPQVRKVMAHHTREERSGVGKEGVRT